MTDYERILTELKKKDETISSLESKLNDSKHPSKKQLKISTTIQDLRFTLEKQID